MKRNGATRLRSDWYEKTLHSPNSYILQIPLFSKFLYSPNSYILQIPLFSKFLYSLNSFILSIPIFSHYFILNYYPPPTTISGTPQALLPKPRCHSMLAASGLLASALQAHGALRAEPLTAHASRARPILARDDDLVFSRRKMEATLAEARYEVSKQLEEQADQISSGSCLSMPSLVKQSIVGYQLAWILGSLLLIAEAGAHLVHLPPPVASLLDPHLALDGILVGIPSAVLVSRLERWRSGSNADRADRRQSLAEVRYLPRLAEFAAPTLQLAFLPVRPFFPLFAETSGKQVVHP